MVTIPVYMIVHIFIIGDETKLIFAYMKESAFGETGTMNFKIPDY